MKRGSTSTEDEVLKKIRRYERKLNKERSKLNLTSEENEAQPQPGPSQERKEDNSEETESQTPEDSPETPATDESLPEEFLLALGDEGNITEKIGESIRQEIVGRWENIMKTGIHKEKWTSLIDKYLTPKNFSKAIAPKLNSELVAALSEAMVKRDKKFEYRQNLIGKILSCLGSLLTDIMKGNLNSVKLIEGINDSAKILCNMYHYDTIVRRYLALSSMPASVRQAITSAPTDSLLLGENLGERMKTAKTMERNSSLFQVNNNKQAIKKQPLKSNNTNLNWKGPSQKTYQNEPRTRGGPRNQQHYQSYQQRYQPYQMQQHQHRRAAPKPQQSRPARRR